VIQVVCALIENGQGQLLACKRAQKAHLGGCWEFPGGKVEAGEGPEAALKREIEEELAVVIEVGEPMQPVEWSDGKVAIRLMPFRCILLDGEPQPHDHEEILWCDASGLTDLNWAPADVPILNEWLSLGR